MSLSSAARVMITRLLDWWRDREDERLDELVAIYARESDGPSGLALAGEIQSRISSRDGHSIS